MLKRRILGYLESLGVDGSVTITRERVYVFIGDSVLSLVHIDCMDMEEVKSKIDSFISSFIS